MGRPGAQTMSSAHREQKSQKHAGLRFSSFLLRNFRRIRREGNIFGFQERGTTYYHQ
jgi:hypothetical protein